MAGQATRKEPAVAVLHRLTSPTARPRPREQFGYVLPETAAPPVFCRPSLQPRRDAGLRYWNSPRYGSVLSDAPNHTCLAIYRQAPIAQMLSGTGPVCARMPRGAGNLSDISEKIRDWRL